MFYARNENGMAIRKLRYTGSNGQGDCFVKKDDQFLPTLKMSVDFTKNPSPVDLRSLIIMSERLQVPLDYDFDKDIASIEIVSKKSLQEANKISR